MLSSKKINFISSNYLFPPQENFPNDMLMYVVHLVVLVYWYNDYYRFVVALFSPPFRQVQTMPMIDTEFEE